MTKSQPSSQKFGAHLSVAGGLHLAFDEALEVGCDCLQIFVKNQRQWKANPLSDEQVRLYKAAQERSGVSPVIAHASYLINLASPEDANRTKSRDALTDELERCEALGVSGLVVHPGAHMGSGMESGIIAIAKSLDEVHHATSGFRCRVLLETTAGQGSTVGHQVEQLGGILDRTKSPDRLGVCVDTCHVFAAGYDIRKASEYERLLDELTRFVGIERIECIHTNDSKGDCGSHLDRHEHITKGKIGKQGFEILLNDARLAAVPRILETPKGTDGRGVNLDKVNLNRMKKLTRR